MTDLLLTTTHAVEGARVVRHHGLVMGEVVYGANIFRDLFASIRDVVGGRAGAYEEVLRTARDQATEEMMAQARAMGANAIVGVEINAGSLGARGAMLHVTITGTAVTIEGGAVSPAPWGR
jgi:uncharacterized protein YbjQ (UPF0145 family)